MTSPFVRVLFVSTPSIFPKWAWWVRVFGRSEFVHVAATSMVTDYTEPNGMTEVVMNATLAKGVEFWPYSVWTRCPDKIGFVWSIKVPARRWPDLNRHEDPTRRRVWRYILRWATRGRVPCDDCVTKVRRMLTEAGVETPDSIVTPGDLFDFLRGEGHDLCSTDSNTYLTPLSPS